MRIGATKDGTITAIAHESTSGNLPDGDPETAVNQTKLLYAGANRLTAMKLAHLDLPEGNAMRAQARPRPDGLGGRHGRDGGEARDGPGRVPHTQRHPGRPAGPKRSFSHRDLVGCLKLGAEKFGWSKRNAKPGQMRDGQWLVGVGMAAAFRNNMVMKSGARVRLVPTARSRSRPT